MKVPLNAKAALLQVLDDPGHGLELIRRVQTRTRGRVRLRQGSVYPALQQLECDGLVRSWKGVPPKGGGRPRTYYELTLKGVRASTQLKETFAALLQAHSVAAPSSREIAQMQERLRRCAEVSAFCMDLRRAALQQAGS
jgi:DNA-binding PadR family transcriptional regulator